jgi:hypothetical protein
MTITTLEEAEMTPGEHSDTRTKPLPLTNSHGRYTNVAPERTLCPLGNGRHMQPL